MRQQSDPSISDATSQMKNGTKKYISYFFGIKDLDPLRSMFKDEIDNAMSLLGVYTLGSAVPCARKKIPKDQV